MHVWGGYQASDEAIAGRTRWHFCLSERVKQALQPFFFFFFFYLSPSYSPSISFRASLTHTDTTYPQHTHLWTLLHSRRYLGIWAGRPGGHQQQGISHIFSSPLCLFFPFLLSSSLFLSLHRFPLWLTFPWCARNEEFYPPIHRFSDIRDRARDGWLVGWLVPLASKGWGPGAVGGQVHIDQQGVSHSMPGGRGVLFFPCAEFPTSRCRPRRERNEQ